MIFFGILSQVILIYSTFSVIVCQNTEIFTTSEPKVDFSELFFDLVDLTNSTNLIKFTINQSSSIISYPHYNQKLPTVIYSHGYKEKVEFWTVQNITAAYSVNKGFNIILVDYGAYSGCSSDQKTLDDFKNVVNNVVEIGKIVGNALWNAFGEKVENLELVGHSLGAHLCAYINRAIATAPGNTKNLKAKKIIALDAAGPLFYTFKTKELNPLNSSDAEVVHAIHTDVIAAGARNKIGTADFYPNDGVQAGCDRIDLANLLTNTKNYCSHQRSVLYHAEAILSKTNIFDSLKCDSWTSFQNGLCFGNEVAHMCQDFNKDVKGTFYLQTNGKSSFSRGTDGLNYNGFPWLKFILVDGSNTSNLINFTYDEISTIPTNPVYRHNHKTAIFSFGYQQSIESIIELIKSYKSGSYPDYNIIIIDWYDWDKPPYQNNNDKNIESLQQTGRIIGIKFWNVFGENLKNFELVGHSAGAHLSAFINRGVRTASKDAVKIPIIYGLDPSSLGFYNARNNYSPVNDPLNQNDANAVIVIHTDSFNFGTPIKIGTADFWPNGGSKQPGCGENGETGRDEGLNLCSHHRSILLFFEAFISKSAQFYAYKCNLWEDFKSGYCRGNDVQYLVKDSHEESTGDFYFQTNGVSPFGRHKAGLVFEDSIE